MTDTNNRLNPTTVGVPDAYPYGQVGVMPKDAVVTALKGPHMVDGARKYYSDAPYIAPTFAEQMECEGVRSNGLKCHAKVIEYSAFCKDHQSQIQQSE